MDLPMFNPLAIADLRLKDTYIYLDCDTWQVLSHIIFTVVFVVSLASVSILRVKLKYKEV